MVGFQGTLLAADDGSPAGRHATAVAERLARRVEGGLTVVTVLSSPGDALPMSLTAADPRIAYGIPSIEIVRAAEAIGAGLLVMGRAGAGPCHPRLGSTADGVVRRSLVPTLFVPLGQSEFRRVAIAIDGTERGMAVLHIGEELPGLGAAEVAILMVEPVSDSASTPPPGERIRVLDAAARFRGLPAPAVHVLEGEPTAVIAKHLVRTAVDLLVIGVRHGAGGASSGVGRGLLHAAPCAVLTIPI